MHVNIVAYSATFLSNQVPNSLSTTKLLRLVHATNFHMISVYTKLHKYLGPHRFPRIKAQIDLTYVFVRPVECVVCCVPAIKLLRLLCGRQVCKYIPACTP